MSESLELLTSFVAPPIVRRYNRHPELPSEARFENYDGVVLFLDISGFTKMTEELAKHGSEGTEQITRILNTNFDTLVEHVVTHGGEVVKFAGDAFAAVWLMRGGSNKNGSNGKSADNTSENFAGRMGKLVQRACACALRIQNSTGKIGQGKRVKATTFADQYQPAISFKIGIGTGGLQLAHVGGVNQRWDLLMKGKALEKAVSAEGCASPGDTVLEHDAVSLVSSYVIGRDDAWYYFLRDLKKWPKVKDVAAGIKPSPEIESALRLYIPDAVQDRVDAGQGDFIGELRRVTVLFINLPDIRSRASVTQDQRIVQDVQEVVFRFEGAINKLSIDDKGVSVLSVFGLPPNSHESDPERGVRAALEIQKKFSPRKIRSSIGVTTGRAFCGAIGSAIRREYTVIGDIVNLSARLMQAAKGGILCDVNTHESTAQQLSFKELPKIKVKGKQDPVPIFRPVGAGTRHVGSPAQVHREFIVGRDNERAALVRATQEVDLRKPSQVMIVQGEPGTGKSHLVQHTMMLAEQNEIKTALGLASSIERATPYLAFRGLFIDLLGLRTTTRRQSPRDIIAKLLADREDLAKLAPVLSDILKIKIPDNDHTKKLDGKVRVDRAMEVLMHLMRVSAREQRYLLVLEDVHWFDSASWELLVALVQNVPGLLVLLTSRALPLPPPQGYLQVLRRETTKTMRLANLSPEDTSKLVCNRLGVDEIPKQVGELVYEHSHGNPFFTHELSLNLETTGIVEIDDGICRIADRFQHGKISVPNTIEGVVTSRIDSLTPSEQLTLKVASVIGREFQTKTLQEIFPVGRERPSLKRYLLKLQGLGFLASGGDGKNRKYIFQHVIIQEVSYQLMLHQQRSKLHEAVAKWYEQTHGRSLERYVGLLAHHYSHAGPTKATDAFRYIDLAGEAAIQAGASREAIQYYSRALELAEKYQDTRSTVAQWRKAGWQRRLSDALFAMGNRQAATERAEQALVTVGAGMPTSNFGWKMLALKGVAVFLARQFLPQSVVWTKSKELSRTLAEYSHAARRLGELFYYDYREMPMLGASFLAVNKGNRVRNFSGAPYSYAMLAQIYGTRGRHRKALKYFKMAQGMAEKLNRPAALVFSTNARVGYLAGTGALTSLGPAVTEAVDLAEIYGDKHDSETTWLLKSQIQYLAGQLEPSIESAKLAFDSARERGNRQHETVAEIAQARGEIALGHFEKVVEVLERLKPQLRAVTDVGAEVVCFGLLGLAKARLGNLGEARVAAMESLARASQSKVMTFGSLHGYEAAVEVCIAIWVEAQAQNSKYTKSFGENVQSSFLLFEKFTGRFQLARPSLALQRARYAIALGDIRKAGKYLETAMAKSREMKIPYIEAQVVFELSRFGGTPPHLRNHYRTTAQDLFWRMRSQYFIEQIEAQATASRD